MEPPAAARARQPLTAGPRGVPFLSRGAGRVRIITRRCRLGQFLPAGILGNGKETPVAHGCPARIAPWFLFIAPIDQSVWLVGLSRQRFLKMPGVQVQPPLAWTLTRILTTRPAACCELGRCTCEGLETSRFNHGCFRSTRVVFLSTSSLLRHAGIHGYMFSAENSDSSDSAEIVYSVSGLKLKEMRA